MVSIEQMALVLDALPDPVFVLSRSGRYVAVFGGRDARYYHDGKALVGLNIADVVTTDKADWFLEQIALALDSKQLLIKEYELSNTDVDGVPDEGPDQPIWFEGRVQALDFIVSGEDVVLWVASNISERHELEIQLRELSDTDQLTGLYSRRKFERDLSLHYETLERHGIETSVLMFDLDNLKTVNDSLGHYAGDEIILAVGDVCRAQLRKNDLACRFGGDEFVAALPSTSADEALQFADRLREYFEQELARISIDGISVTVSIGVATLELADASYQDALKRADNALYEAKRSGKNRVSLG